MDLKFILGRKEGMTQVFTPEGEAIPVTVVEAGPCTVVQVKTPDSDGYSSVQLGFMDKKLQRTSKPLKGHFKKAAGGGDAEGEKKKAEIQPKRYLREFRIPLDSEYAAGDLVTVEIFEEGDLIDVTGFTKGRGFTGVMKRWNFRGGPATHGAMCNRRPGSIGMHSDPSRVFKGKKMAGRYGNERVTVKNLEVVGTIPDRNVLLVKGAVPGARNGLLRIRTAKTGVPRKAKAEAEAS